MATNASVHGQNLQEAQRDILGSTAKGILALFCLAGGIAPLAARSIPGEGTRIAYGLVVTALLLAITLLCRRSSALRRFWELPFAFFILAVVQVLNNSVPPFILAHVLHEHTVSGNPLASTLAGTVVIQLLETAIAIVPIVVLIKFARLELGSIYWRMGTFGRAYAFALISLVAVYSVVGMFPRNRQLPINGAITVSHYLTLTPALLVLVISNGFQEEFLFRGLFLQRYNPFFGVVGSNILQALVFAFAHVGVAYTPNALVFILVFVFPLGLIAGALMRRSNGAVAPAIFHAAVDIPIYLAFLTHV